MISLFSVVLISLIGIAIGLFFLFNPAVTIKIQKQFYEKINWKIEPISMPKEIRNTRMMGLFLIIFSLLAIIFAIRM
jgi:uncharacterized membrane protein HdeD (DUF308 family)